MMMMMMIPRDVSKYRHKANGKATNTRTRM